MVNFPLPNVNVSPSIDQRNLFFLSNKQVKKTVFDFLYQKGPFSTFYIRKVSQKGERKNPMKIAVLPIPPSVNTCFSHIVT